MLSTSRHQSSPPLVVLLAAMSFVLLSPAPVALCESLGLTSWLVACCVVVFLLFPSLGYTEPFLRGCLGLQRVPAWLAVLRPVVESRHFELEARLLTGQNGGVLLETLATRWAETAAAAPEPPLVITASDDEPLDPAIANLVVIPGRLHLTSRYYYRSAAFPALWKYKSALESCKLAIALLACLPLLVLVTSHSTQHALSSLALHAPSSATWSSLDAWTAIACSVLCAVLVQFYLVQLGCVKLGKMSCHLAAQVERDGRTALASQHCKMRTNVIAHSQTRLDASLRALLACAVGLLSCLVTRHGLTHAHCQGWASGVTAAELDPWRAWFGVFHTLTLAGMLLSSVQALSAMWNILTEQMRQEMGVEEPRWFELPFLYCTDDIQQSWLAAQGGHPVLTGRFLLLLLARHCCFVCTEGLGWIGAQLLSWCTTALQLWQSVVSGPHRRRMRNLLVDAHLLPARAEQERPGASAART